MEEGGENCRWGYMLRWWVVGRSEVRVGREVMVLRWVGVACNKPSSITNRQLCGSGLGWSPFASSLDWLVGLYSFKVNKILHTCFCEWKNYLGSIAFSQLSCAQIEFPNTFRRFVHNADNARYERWHMRH